MAEIFAEIVMPVAVNHTFTYSIPKRLADEVQPGCRALVPFGPRKTTGFIVGLTDTTHFPELKEIVEVLDPVPLFTPEVLKLARWIADYYLCGWGEVLKAALPSGIHLDSEKIVRLVHPDPQELFASLSQRASRQADIVRLLMTKNPIPMRVLTKQLNTASAYSSLKKLREDGHVRMELELPKAKVQQQFEIYLKLNKGIPLKQLASVLEKLRQRAPKQAECLDLFYSSPDEEFSRFEVSQHVPGASEFLRHLMKKGFITFERRQIMRDYYGDVSYDPPQLFHLNADQEKALQAVNSKVDAGEFTTFLLHGVTGSGKTQVYIEAIHHVLEQGRTAIVLVPEIALTPQMVQRFRSRFGAKVAVFHSRMSPGERYDSWRRTWEGGYQIVIGPRSAIFSPLKNIGLIVVDEEHEPSYKQAEPTPRYHARDVAVVRASIDNAVVMLGSATPVLESYFNMHVGKYHLLELPKRIDDVPMPEIQIVDMRREPKIIGRKDPIIFSRQLRQKIDEKLARGEQIILLQNRRGFATFLQCKECGFVAKCSNCSITLTFHINGHFLKCHYCGYSKNAPSVCPQCQCPEIYYKGIGTQRVEEELHQLFPGISAVRMDMDTTRGRQAHDRILAQFATGKYQILLGTQMVAKGLDFPNVTLVGVISADTQLLFPDFRAGERTFSLLTQVAGRAGRKDKLGQVIIQTYAPDHYSLYHAQTHDYHGFFKAELKDRKELLYPPFTRIVNMIFRGPDEKAVQKVAEQFHQLIDKKSCYKILGPSPATLTKIQGNFRWQILLMSLKQSDPGGNRMKTAILDAMQTFRTTHHVKNVKIIIDADPVSIL
jgi:primosomal protein N' (replication factor Y) (superfamily II helicase)